MIMYGGFKWLTSRGNPQAISGAKEIIFNALTGMVLAFMGFLILYIINPAMTQIKMPALNAITGGGASSFSGMGPTVGMGLAGSHGSIGGGGAAAKRQMCGISCICQQQDGPDKDHIIDYSHPPSAEKYRQLVIGINNFRMRPRNSALINTEKRRRHVSRHLRG